MQKNDIPKFNHLKIHTQYSICEGAIKIDNLKDFCKERKIKAIGIQTNETKDYRATFIVKSIGNQNITAEVTLDIKGTDNINENRNWNITLIFASFGIIGISYLIYQRRIE